eukprot:CAMPEP_0174942660 /NCGR_PEP_ID=MMETSP1355-20121228/74827_1 /TAXON_ID=464990 /ORGANISM="Hemiselmis tepida, Strain CCMP443" /LENGTH=94 /DNA_ID=CAMNT_0016189843 /DNA_START=11 /DNA_END=292 /DNA_ORIENTATION=-
MDQIRALHSPFLLRSQSDGVMDPMALPDPTREDPAKPACVPSICVDTRVLADAARRLRQARNEEEDEKMYGNGGHRRRRLLARSQSVDSAADKG